MNPPCNQRATTTAKETDTVWTALWYRSFKLNRLEQDVTVRYPIFRVRLPLALPCFHRLTGFAPRRATTRNAPAEFPPNKTKPSCRQLARQNWPAFAHMGATGATAPPSGRTAPGCRRAALWLRGRQLGVRDPPGLVVRVRTGAGDEVIMSIAGHVTRAMLSRHSHVRMEAKRRALDEIAAPSACSRREAAE